MKGTYHLLFTLICSPEYLVRRKNHEAPRYANFSIQGRWLGSRAPVKNFFSGPAARTNKQRATYARWPLAASAVHLTIRYLIASDTKEKDKNVQHIRAPGPTPDRRALTSPPSLRHYLQPPITFPFWCHNMVTDNWKQLIIELSSLCPNNLTLRYAVDLYVDTTRLEYRPGYRLPSGSGYLSRFSDSLHAEQSGDRIPVTDGNICPAVNRAPIPRSCGW